MRLRTKALGALDIRNPELSESINIIPTNQRYLLEKKNMKPKENQYCKQIKASHFVILPY